MSNLRLPNISTYAEADKYLGSKSEHRIGFKTVAHRITDGVIAIRYHDTDIVTYYADGSILLDSGGWATVTTVNRMHHLTPANVRVNGKYPKTDMPSILVTIDDGDPIGLGNTLLIKA